MKLTKAQRVAKIREQILALTIDLFDLVAPTDAELKGAHALTTGVTLTQGVANAK